MLFARILNLTPALAVSIFLLGAVSSTTADFDGDGVADEFDVTREAEKVASGAGVRAVNLWQSRGSARQPPQGLGLVVRLTAAPQTFLFYDADFFSTPIWVNGKPPARVVSKNDPGYSAWKKRVGTLRGDAIQLGTEAGIDILLYWDGRWRLFWPNEEP
ncbi:MAG TPA: hypothetical protein VJS88_00105 [Chthoniobacterales bacterium]|nr:hypothetical protein [Chthoniobacterales bacterium]